jgi:uncharacterized protein (TIGR02757 family)
MKKKHAEADWVYHLLEAKYRQYGKASFADGDPISVIHGFTRKEDIEIMGFWTAMLSWGNRKSIISSSLKLRQYMDNAPYEFMKHHSENDLKRFLHFSHRTFNPTDALYFIEFLSYWYKNNNSLENAFTRFMTPRSKNVEEALTGFHELFFSLEDAPPRTRKHVATPVRKSSCKRINMFLRWMVRSNKNGVDFGLWKNIKPAQLLCPLDVHVDRVARKLGLIKRRQTDWLAVLELTENLKAFDPVDPVKYDYALFGIGALDKGELGKIVVP